MKRLLLAAALCVAPLTLMAGSPAPMSKAVDSKEAWRRTVVASVLVLEAGGDGRKGMEAVFHVVVNRAGSRLSPYAVVTKRSQFSTMSRGASAAVARARTSRFKDALPEALAIYDRWQAGMLGPDFTHGSLYFESFRRSPRSFRTFTHTIRVGDNKFYK